MKVRLIYNTDAYLSRNAMRLRAVCTDENLVPYLLKRIMQEDGIKKKSSDPKKRIGDAVKEALQYNQTLGWEDKDGEPLNYYMEVVQTDESL